MDFDGLTWTFLSWVVIRFLFQLNIFWDDSSTGSTDGSKNL